MTTIAWDGTYLAADTQVGNDDHIDNLTTSKVLDIPGYCMAYAGDVNTGVELIAKVTEYYKAGIPKPEAWVGLSLPTTTNPDLYTEFLLIPIGSPCGYVYRNNTGAWSPVQPPYAIGSGYKYAEGAMYAGANAMRAVEAGIRFDTQSGGSVDYIPTCPQHAVMNAHLHKGG